MVIDLKTEVVGDVWGGQTWSPDDSWELTRTIVSLPDVSIDEI